MKTDKLLTNKNILLRRINLGNRSIFFLGMLLIAMNSFSCKSIAQTASENSIKSNTDTIPNVNYTLQKAIEIEAKLLTTDKLLNSYVISQNDELIKFSKEGKELYRYSNFDLGEISHIDASNPFNLLIFYEEYQTVEILDRTLDRTASFDLFETGLSNVRAIALSNDQQIWIYDELTFKIKKMNANGEIVFESADLSNLLVDNYSPSFMFEKAGNIYLIDESKDVFFFDVFGNFAGMETFTVPLSKLQLLDDLYVYRDNSKFYIKDFQVGDLNENYLVLPTMKSNIIDAEIQKNHMFILSERQLSIYTFAPKQ